MPVDKSDVKKFKSFHDAMIKAFHEEFGFAIFDMTKHEDVILENLETFLNAVRLPEAYHILPYIFDVWSGLYFARFTKYGHICIDSPKAIYMNSSYPSAMLLKSKFWCKIILREVKKCFTKKGNPNLPIMGNLGIGECKTHYKLIKLTKMVQQEIKAYCLIAKENDCYFSKGREIYFRNVIASVYKISEAHVEGILVNDKITADSTKTYDDLLPLIDKFKLIKSNIHLIEDEIS